MTRKEFFRKVSLGPPSAETLQRRREMQRVDQIVKEKQEQLKKKNAPMCSSEKCKRYMAMEHSGTCLYCNNVFCYKCIRWGDGSESLKELLQGPACSKCDLEQYIEEGDG